MRNNVISTKDLGSNNMANGLLYIRTIKKNFPSTKLVQHFSFITADDCPAAKLSKHVVHFVRILTGFGLAALAPPLRHFRQVIALVSYSLQIVPVFSRLLPRKFPSPAIRHIKEGDTDTGGKGTE